MSSHKPRKKRVSIQNPTDSSGENDFPLESFLWPSRGTSQWILLPLILIITGLFRWIVGFWGYSGYGISPMYGDFEAQRHWMEITNNLPMSKWYFYDLQYWGLDYPPLTAYHSWLCGKIGSIIDPTWFTLEKSRGNENPNLKVFMRSTVLISEYLVYVPALIIFLRHYSKSTSVALIAILMQPATILIDHGHFQYNTVMLGFVIAWISSIYSDRYLWSCIFFVAALGFKQMALYYSPVVFAYLLGSCFTPRFRPIRLVSISIVTIISFSILFAPILSTSSIQIQLRQIIHRCFPFARGLFEDKVANFWCFLNTFYKLRNLQGIIELPRLSAFFTFMSILPSMFIIGAIPRKSLVLYALASSAWGFFLFSFQVHEKSVLLPLLPTTLLLGSKNGLNKEFRAWIGWANILGVWTMYPLLKRDELKTPYVVVSLLWIYLIGLPPTSVSAYYDPEHENIPGRPLAPDELRTPTKILHFQYYVIMAFWHLLAVFATPPDDKPDLWVVVNSCIGALGFGICYLWCTWKLILESGLLDDYFSHRESIDSKAE